MTDPSPIPIRPLLEPQSRGREQAWPLAWPAVLRALREARGLTQEGWGAHLGVSDVTIRRWERGAAVPTAAAEVAIVAWCNESRLFQRFRSGPLAGVALTPELLGDLLAEARLATRTARAASPPGGPVPTTALSAGIPTAAARPPTVLQPVRSAPTVHGGALPAPATRLVGREAELEQLSDLLTSGRSRLITLTGAGGTGKTRLALAAAAQVADRFGGRTWFVPLEAIRDPALVPTTIVKGLGGDISGSRPPLETAADMLRGEPALLLVDNFEQVLPAAKALSDLLAACPELVLLVTSRAALRVRGERELPVPPLATPHLRTTVHAATAERYAAVELFVERAADVQPGFRLTEQNADAIGRICARLDGLPLAIELAAVWVKVLSPASLQARLEQATPLPAGRSRDLPARQQTLHAAIAWSYDLLQAEEQALLRRLAVFSGGWTLGAAQAVCGVGQPGIEGRAAGPHAPAAGHAPLGGASHPPGVELPAADVLPLLAQLVDQSLVVVETAAEEPRYRLLETIRWFASEKLETAGETELFRTRHRNWCLAFAEEAGNAGVSGLEGLEREHDNLRAALSWRRERTGDAAVEAEIRLRLVAALWRFWQVRGYIAEGRQWLAMALEQAGPVQSAARARALNGAGSLAYYAGDMAAARDSYQAAYDARIAVGDERQALAALSNLAISAFALGDLDTAYDSWDRALTLARALGDQRNIALALGGLSLKAQADQDHALAMTLLEEAHQIWLALGDTLWIARSLGNMCAVAFYAGDMERARALAEQSTAMARESGNRRNLAMGLLYLGRTATKTGDLDVARCYLAESLDAFAEMGDRTDVARALEALATLAGVSEHTTQAALLFGAAERIRTAHRQPHFPFEQVEYDVNLAIARAGVDDAAWTAAWSAGYALTLDQAVAAARELMGER